MQKLKRSTNLFEFILGAQMVFSILVEVHSVLYPINILSDQLEALPEYKRPKNPHANHSDMLDYLSFFGFCFWLACKYLFEGLRFNTMIICAAEMFFFLDRALQFADKVFCQVSAILTILYIWTLVSYPVYEFPQPNGQYPVGYKIIRLEDAYQTKVAIFYPAVDPVEQGLTDQQIRRMTKQIFWSPHNKYLSQVYQYIISRQWIPYPEWVIDFLIGHIYYRKFSVLENAALTTREGGHSVIIFSHGLSQHHNAYSSHAKQWASEGYIVMCPQHEEPIFPWDDKQTKIFWENNKPETMEKYRKIRGSHLNWRIEQVQALIDTISVKSKFREIFTQDQDQTLLNESQYLNPSNLIVGGHSFGGATAIRAAQVDKRVKAIFTFDPWLYPLTDEQLNTQIDKNIPSLHIFKELDSKKDAIYPIHLKKLFLETNSGSKNFKAFKLMGMDHVNPTDMVFMIPSEMEFQGTIRRADLILPLYNIINHLTTGFLGNLDQLDDLLDELDSQSGTNMNLRKQLIKI